MRFFAAAGAVALAFVLTPLPAQAAARDLRLIDAARNGNIAVVRALLQSRVDVNATQPDGATALHWAVDRDRLDIADALLKAGARVNVDNDYGVTPLMLAAANGSGPVVERLLAAGANPNAALPTGETVLMTASRTGRL